ncbi:MAG TPA: hypothetical protein VNH18_09720 [Bryobacteraceae bacterium]|nr:hypothetical protein [Bryobacteraceae bacterium]
MRANRVLAVQDYDAQDHSPSVLFVIILICAALIPSPVNAQSALNPRFVQVAEARSPRTAKQRITLAYRIFSAPALPKTCAEAGMPARLVFKTNSLKLTVGRWFSLNALAVVAVDEAGRPRAGVPLAIEVEAKNPPLLDLRAEMISKADLLPIRAGRFRFRVRTFCPGSTVEAFIPATIQNH